MTNDISISASMSNSVRNNQCFPARSAILTNTNRIIENAAKRSGMPLPLEDETREFGEEFLRSLKATLNWIHGRGPNPCVNQDIHNWLDELKAEAETLRYKL